MPEQKELFSPDTSSKTMEIKKGKARRINNWPVFIAFVVIAVIVLTLGLVFVSRSNRKRADMGGQHGLSGRMATANAREATNLSGGEGGVVNPPPPSPPPPDTPKDTPKNEPKADDKAPPPPSGNVPGARIPEAPRLTDEAKKVRDRRFRQMEQAIDGPIQVRIDENRLQARGLDDEMERLERQIAALNSQEAQTYE